MLANFCVGTILRDLITRSMSRTVSLAQYLFTRLRQLGVGSVHGVPGDYFLRALDHLEPSGLRWIGNCNELNAGYAADGYAKVKGISALMTTYGVGEISALNAVAGSYAEYSPVVHIVGCPARKHYASKSMVHHSLGDGNMKVFAEVYKKFTVAQAALHDPESAPRLIDRTLKRCIKEGRPIYLELPQDMVNTQVQGWTLNNALDLSHRPNDEDRENNVADTVLQRIYSAKQPYILVDGLVAADGVVEEVNEFARVTGLPTLAFTFGGGIMDSTLPNYRGVHAGKYGSLDFTPYTDTADLALLFGPLLSDTNTMGFTTVPSTPITIAFHRDRVRLGGSNKSETHHFHMKSFIRRLTERFDRNRLPPKNPAVATLPSTRNLAKSLPPADALAAIDQDTFYLRISSFFRPHDIILCANGTPLAGSRDFILPPKAQLINSSIFVSVGHFLPATQGVALAQRELETGGRTILFEGDGSFQATAQELSTIIRYKLDAYIFLINNDGYTYERLIHGMEAEYNDLQAWNYLKVPEMMGAPTDGSYEVETHDVGTWGELSEVLKSEKFCDGKGLKMVNIRMKRDDVRSEYKAALEAVGDQLRAEPVERRSKSRML